ncbi:MAG: 6-phosphogluconolactonase [Phycisphaeraceae bacterium]
MTDSQPAKISPADYAATRGLRGQRLILDGEALLDRIAMDLYNTARDRVAEAGVFHLALSGGRTPKALFQHLMIDPNYRLLPWDRTHVWIVDERCVQPDDDRLNYNMIREMLIDPSGMPDPNVHPMPVLDEAGDRAYEQALREALSQPNVDDRLDFVVLGMGADGHTASLFPQTPGLHERERWVIFNDGETVAEPRPRMTMTYPLINAARHIALLVTGESKRDTLRHVAAQPDDFEQYPVTGIRPAEDGKLTWYLDRAAAI